MGLSGISRMIGSEYVMIFGRSRTNSNHTFIYSLHNTKNVIRSSRMNVCILISAIHLALRIWLALNSKVVLCSNLKLPIYSRILTTNMVILYKKKIPI